MQRLSFILLSLIASTQLLALAPPPKGFDDKGLVDELMKGKIAIKELVSTRREYKVLYRSFYKNVSTDDYVAKAQDHDNFKNIFKGIKDSQRIAVVTPGKQFTYKVEMIEKTPLGNITLKPTLEQVFSLGADTAKNESGVTDKVTNYTKDIENAGIATRIVPYEGGLLMAHTCYLHLKSHTFLADSKKNFRNNYAQLVSELRAALKADP